MISGSCGVVSAFAPPQTLEATGLWKVEFGTLGEWAAAVVALVALVLSFVAIGLGRRASRRTVFIDYQERLDDLEVSKGRRTIYTIDSQNDAKKLFDKEPDDWARANRTINLWNTLAQFARRRMLDRDLAFGLWGDSVDEAWGHLEHVIRFRRGMGRPDKWTSLVWFAREYQSINPAHSGQAVSPDLLEALERSETAEKKSQRVRE
jgi:hypothetical protein